MKKDNMPPDLPTNDLRKTKGAFVQHVIKGLEEAEANGDAVLRGKKEKYHIALRQWMDSETRAAVIMSRQRGFAITTPAKSG